MDIEFQIEIPSLENKCSKIDIHSAWVQCQNDSCNKWRRVSREYANTLGDELWFCYMNKEQIYCEAVEEDHLGEEALAKKHGLSIVMSLLPIGTLVWAKMTGFCRWPSILVIDSVFDNHVYMDKDNDASAYFVRFLGKHHTHAWIDVASIELYSKEKIPTPKSTTPKEKAKGKKRRTNITAFKKTTKVKTTYMGGSVKDAIDEANQMLRLSINKRLKHMEASLALSTPPSGRTREKRVTIKKEKIDDQSSDEVIKKSNKLTNRKKCSIVQTVKQPRKLSKKNNVITPKQELETISSRQMRYARRNNTTVVTSRVPSGPAITIKKEADGDDDGDDGDDDDATIVEEVSERSKLRKQLNQRSSLLNKSTEEKFIYDIKMYQRNQKAFEHDLYRFMRRNNRKLSHPPYWQNREIGHFQIFIAVHEKGGYSKVDTMRGGWPSIYSEATHSNVRYGHVVKSYYNRNLLPYELYLSGHPQEQCFIEADNLQHNKNKRPEHREQRVSNVPKGKEMKRIRMQQKEASKLPDTQKWNQMSSAVQPIAISDIKLEPSCAQKGATKVDDNEAFQIESDADVDMIETDIIDNLVNMLDGYQHQEQQQHQYQQQQPNQDQGLYSSLPIMFHEQTPVEGIDGTNVRVVDTTEEFNASNAFHVVPDVAPAAYNLLQNTTGHLLPELQELQVLQDELDDLESQLTYF